VDKRWFIGLASPAAAGLMASFVWTFHDLGFSGTELRYVAAGVCIVAGLLMVSRVRYNSFKSGGGVRAERVPFYTIVIAVAALIALWIVPPRVLDAAALLYALSGPVLLFRRRHVAPVEPA
jgi:CDP-diacylglycerol--serine O-phosphatidyltransferase